MDKAVIDSFVYQTEEGVWVLKIKYPKVGRSHFYSVASHINALWEEQYPEWAERLHRQ